LLPTILTKRSLDKIFSNPLSFIVKSFSFNAPIPLFKQLSPLSHSTASLSSFYCKINPEVQIFSRHFNFLIRHYIFFPAILIFYKTNLLSQYLLFHSATNEPTMWMLVYPTSSDVQQCKVSVLVPPLDASIPQILGATFYNDDNIAVLSFTAFSEGTKIVIIFNLKKN
jgi:hypothetical protein